MREPEGTDVREEKRFPTRNSTPITTRKLHRIENTKNSVHFTAIDFTLIAALPILV